MSQIAPVGTFEICVFQSSDDASEYIFNINFSPELAQKPQVWVEAAACLGSFAAQTSTLGYERMLELITERTMTYRDVLPPAAAAETETSSSS